MYNYKQMLSELRRIPQLSAELKSELKEYAWALEDAEYARGLKATEKNRLIHLFDVLVLKPVAYYDFLAKKGYSPK